MSDDIKKEAERIHEGIVASLSFSEALAKRDAEIERLRGLVDACSIFLKEDETPAQRIERERADTEAVLKLLLKEKREIERLRGLLREAHLALSFMPDPTRKLLDLRYRIREALGDER